MKRKKQPEPQAAPRPLISGVVVLGKREWEVNEEKRQGPRTQILILKATDASKSEMHVRPPPGSEAAALDHVEALAADPAYRWFTDDDGVRWETRIVLPDPPDRMLVKFISWGVGVYEGDYPFTNGLGLRSDPELRELLMSVRSTAEAKSGQ